MDIKTLFLNETWLSLEITNKEVFLGNNIKINGCSDSLYEEHGGVLIASPVFSDLNVIDLFLEQYPFTVACALIDSLSVSFFVNVYNPDTPNYCLALETSKACFEENYMVFESYCVKDWALATLIKKSYILSDFNYPKSDWSFFSSTTSSGLIFWTWLQIST